MKIETTEEELTHLQEFLDQYKVAKADTQQLEVWAARAEQELKAVVTKEQRRAMQTGGDFGERLRAIVEETVVRDANGRVTLGPTTQVRTIGTQILSTGVFVDVRLQIGIL